jgi:probable F420-dependent oxidoreductase
VQFGVALPTCTEGMAYPIPFADHEGIRRIAVEAERLGFDSVLANDHYSTMPYVRDGFADPPRFYEPLITLTYVAAHTHRVTLMTGVVVLPMREPVLLAKQVAALDRISGGRLVLGVGVGAYRAEFESVHPRRAGTARAELVAEGVEALQRLFGERRATYRGQHLAFEDVEAYPKPLQDPFPLLSCGNAAATIERAATACAGWMPAGLPRARLAAGVQAAGRDPAGLTVAPQLVLRIDDAGGAAERRFRESQVHEHLMSLRRSTLRDIDVDAYVSQNLIGTPEQIVDRVAALAQTGANHLAGLIVVADTEAELTEQLAHFARDVLPAFAASKGTA